MTGLWCHDSMEFMLSQTQCPYYRCYSRRRTYNWADRSPSSRASDEHIFPAIVSKRLPCEAAVERFQLETGDIEEPEPLVLGCPPEGALRAIVEGQVDPIVAYGIPDSKGVQSP